MSSTYRKNKAGWEEWVDENGEYHRLDGPALIHPNGAQYWYKNGKRHREDGPAEILPYESALYHKYKWWLNGHKYKSYQYWAREVKADRNLRLVLKIKYNVDLNTNRDILNFKEWTEIVESKIISEK